MDRDAFCGDQMKRGRPQLDAERKRSERITVRMTPREMHRLSFFADINGYSHSDALRVLTVGCLGSRTARINAMSAFETWESESDEVQNLHCQRQNCSDVYLSESKLRQEVKLKRNSPIANSNRMTNSEDYEG